MNSIYNVQSHLLELVQFELQVVIFEYTGQPTRAVCFAVSQTFRAASLDFEFMSVVETAAAAVPHNPVWRWLIEAGYPVVQAVRAGNREIVEYFPQRLPADLIIATFEPDQPEMRQLLLAQGYPITYSNYEAMIRYQRFDLHKQYCDQFGCCALTAARYCFEILRWLLETKECELIPKVFTAAIEGNQHDQRSGSYYYHVNFKLKDLRLQHKLRRYFHENGGTWDAKALHQSLIIVLRSTAQQIIILPSL
jgi:hypothetical protein